MYTEGRILIIDDDETICNSLSMVLRAEGYLVDIAKTGKEAVKMSYENFYNLAIVDWRLPDIEGTELLGKINETTPKMQKIMLTGYPSMNNAIDAVNTGADAFFLKPVHIENLLEKIERLLKIQQEQKNFSEQKMVKYIETKVKMLAKPER